MTRVLSKTKGEQQMLAENTGVKSPLTEEEIKEYVKTEEKLKETNNDYDNVTLITSRR